MKDMSIIIGSVLLIAFILLCQETKYEFAGCGLAMLMLFFFIGIQRYRYNQQKRQMSDISFKFKRDNFIWTSVNCMIFSKIAYDAFIKMSYNTSGINSEYILSLLLCGTVFFQLYMCIFQIPILSTDGFLCSDGTFIRFVDVKNVSVEDNPMLKYKKITVEYNEKKSQVFKVDDRDYDSIKNHLNIFGSIIVEEKFIKS